MLGPSERSVSARHRDVVITERGQALARAAGQVLDSFDAEDLAREPAQNGRRVARARADVEHAIRPVEPQRFGRQGHDIRLRDGLAASDR
jgi:hypothetical protein